MADKTRGIAERALVLAGALLLAGLGWLVWRYQDHDTLHWVFWVAGAGGALFAMLAPVRWLRTLLHLNIFTQDMFRK